MKHLPRTTPNRRRSSKRRPPEPDLHGASIYSSMEPCSTRSSEPESCSELILRHGFSRTVFALYEPSCFVCCEGAVRLRKGGVEVRVYPQLAGEVRAINGHLGLHE